MLKNTILAVLAILMLVGAGFAVKTDPGHSASEIGGTDIADRTFQNANYSFQGSLGIGTAAPGAKLDVTVSSGPAAILGESCTASGEFSVAMGTNSDASGASSLALGDTTHASGYASFATGTGTSASGTNSVAMGAYSETTGNYSLASGYDTTAGGSYSVALGHNSVANGLHSLAIGNNSQVNNSAGSGIALGDNAWAAYDHAIAIGTGTYAGIFSVAIGTNASAGSGSSYYCTALGKDTTATGMSTAVGLGTFAGGQSTAMGADTVAYYYSTAMGRNTFASNYSLASGYLANAVGEYSFASGYNVNASGDASFAAGKQSVSSSVIASGIASVSMGYGTRAYGDESLALGYETVSYGDYSFAAGHATSTGPAATSSVAMGSNMNVNNANSFGIGLSDDGYNLNQAHTMSVMGGLVGINTTTPNVALDVVGDIEYTGTITDVSDARLKENFAPIEAPMSKLQQINGVSFNMIGSDKRELGVIAQDVQKVFPEAVSVIDPENGYLGVSYVSLVPVLIEAAKEQQGHIDALESENAELKALVCLDHPEAELCN